MPDRYLEVTSALRRAVYAAVGADVPRDEIEDLVEDALEECLAPEDNTPGEPKRKKKS
jgi:DNA-directed RNA polymerase specialized sigma24 family protein